jgi:hypothetical protein
MNINTVLPRQPPGVLFDPVNVVASCEYECLLPPELLQLRSKEVYIKHPMCSQMSIRQHTRIVDCFENLMDTT